jgi:hypothetical protein
MVELAESDVAWESARAVSPAGGGGAGALAVDIDAATRAFTRAAILAVFFLPPPAGGGANGTASILSSWDKRRERVKASVFRKLNKNWIPV